MYTPEATLYKPVPTSELGFRLRHLASGASPLCISDVYKDFRRIKIKNKSTCTSFKQTYADPDLTFT